MEIPDRIAAFLSRLPEPDATVLTLHYGLHGNAPHTLAEIGTRMHILPDEALRIRDRALALVRGFISQNDGGPESLEYG